MVFPCGVRLTVDTTPLTPILLTLGPTTAAEAHAKRERELAESLAQLAVTRAEAALFLTVQYGIHVEPSHLIRCALGDSHDFGPFTEGECRTAWNACLEKGWLQIIDESALAQIVADIQTNQLLGPIYGLPPMGTVDFTLTGAALSMRIFRGDDRSRSSFAYTDVVHEKSSRFFRSKTNAVAEIDSVRTDDDFATVSEPIPIGPWRAQWWRRFPAGYRIDIEQRREWKGRCSIGNGEQCYLNRSHEKPDLLLLRQVLERYGVSFAEWVLMKEMEGGPRRFERQEFLNLVTSAAREFDHPVTVEECREGLEDCLCNGWLRLLDQRLIDEIHALLRDDAVVLAVPKTARLQPEGSRCSTEPHQTEKLVFVPIPIESRWGEIDFSQIGAALYRTISTEWLGPDWENDLHVSNEHYLEEHRYCFNDDGLPGIAAEYTAEGFDVRVREVVPIGPWCVYWWERYPSGYRMKLEISQRNGIEV